MNEWSALVQQLCCAGLCGLVAGVGLLSAAYLVFGQVKPIEVEVIDIPVAIEETGVISLPVEWGDE